ncbi:MAG: hypothetical protein Q7S00_05545, partial [bacterium]|nr:hypothetical protein [bacterium]
MAKVLLDTSIYIPLLRQGKMPGTLLDTPDSTLYLSVIVAQELLAGAGDLKTSRTLEDLFRSFEKHRRLITPSGEDWFLCGNI